MINTFCIGSIIEADDVTRVVSRNGVETILVRESYRDEGKVKRRTVANIT